MPIRTRLATISVLVAVSSTTAPADAQAPPTPPGPGYWLATADGGVFAHGRAGFAGSMSGAPVEAAMVAMASTPTGNGYWLAAGDGGVFAFGDAPYLGGVTATTVDAGRVVDIAATPTGRGYWLATDQGTVHAFGDAVSQGDLRATAVNEPVTAIAGTPGGDGYWLVAEDGGVFAFGAAEWRGAMAGTPLNRPVVDMAVTPDGQGYLLLGADGGVFAFGRAGFAGQTAGIAHQRAVGIATTPTGQGYWVATRDGGVFAFGDAGFYGSVSGVPLQGPVVGLAAGLGSTVPDRTHKLSSRFGWDISWPQCGGRYPAPTHAYAVVGVTDGHAFSVNPCLADQHRWSQRHGSLAGLYVNVNYPSRATEPTLPTLMAGTCPADDLGCQLYEWGRRGAQEAFAAASAVDARTPLWWMDIETTNRWSTDTVANARIIQGAIDALEGLGVRVGIYSTPYQWRVIAGAFSPGLPTWVAGPTTVDGAAVVCRDNVSFGGGETWMVQYPHEGYDGNLMCDAGARNALTSFRLPPLPEVPLIDRPEPVARTDVAPAVTAPAAPGTPRCRHWLAPLTCRRPA